jgi:hypothetical protein
MGQFLDRIMSINVLRMGGAFAGIVGSSGTDNIVLNNLKRTAVTIARAYNKPATQRDELVELSEQIDGYLQTLQLTSTLSKEEVDGLMEQLESLIDNSSAK